MWAPAKEEAVKEQDLAVKDSLKEAGDNAEKHNAEKHNAENKPNVGSEEIPPKCETPANCDTPANCGTPSKMRSRIHRAFEAKKQAMRMRSLSLTWTTAGSAPQLTRVLMPASSAGGDAL